MTEQTDDALVLMERALVSRDPLELALAGFLSAYKGRTFDKQRRVIKHYVDWCMQNDLPPLQAKRPHIELFVRWCETQPWSESYICQHFVGVRSFYKTCVRDDVLLRDLTTTSSTPPGQLCCPACWTPFLRVRRQKCCSDNCRKTAWARQRRHRLLLPVLRQSLPRPAVVP